MRVLVTGAAGFIGSHTCEALLRRGTPVVGLDNFDPYYDVSLKHDNVRVVEQTATEVGTNFTMVEGDLCDRELIDSLVPEHNVSEVIHLAAKAGVQASLKDPIGYARANVEGTVNLLEVACRKQVKRFIFGSSSSVYGRSGQAPFCEDQPVNMPISPYAASKVAGEAYCHTYHTLYGLPVVCLRFFTVFGPRQRPDLAISKFVQLMSVGEPIPKYGDGSTLRDYTFIGDIVRGIQGALDSDIAWDIINLGSDRPISLNQLIAAIEEGVGQKAIIDQQPLQPGDMRLTHADINHARQVLGWEPEVSLKDGLKQFLDWWKSRKGQGMM